MVTWKIRKRARPVDASAEEAEKPKKRLTVIEPQRKTPSLIEMIESVQHDRNTAHHFFRPSMISGCPRQNVFHYTRVPKEPQKLDFRFARILDTGTATHTVVQGYLSNLHDWWFVSESRVTRLVEGARVRGSCDGVLIERKNPDNRYGVEIKTINSMEFAKLTKPKPDHVRQASIYAALQDLHWIIILYWDKNTQNLKEFPVNVTDDSWAGVREDIRRLKGFVDRGEVPKYNPSRCDKTFCQYVDHCRRLGAPV